MSQNTTPLQHYDVKTLAYCPYGAFEGSFPFDVEDDGVTNGVIHGGVEDNPGDLPVFFARGSGDSIQTGVDDGGTPEDPEDDTPIYEDVTEIEFFQVSTDNLAIESVKVPVSFGGLGATEALASNPWDPLIVYEATDLYDSNGEQVNCSFVVEQATPDLFSAGNNVGYVRLWARLPKEA